MKSLFRCAAFALGVTLLSGLALAQTCPAGYPLSTPSSDFADAGGGTVRHLPTGLIWKRCAEGQDWNGSTCTGSAAGYNWQQAFQRAHAVNAGAVGTWNAGQTDWRVPNVNELKSIVESGCYGPAINTVEFPATLGSFFWSGSPFAGYSDNAWYVLFGIGDDSWSGRSNAYQVRLVRAGQYFYNFDAAAAAPTIGGMPPSGTVGVAYSFTPSATGSPAFTATGLPPGLAINPATGAITGTPTAAGSYNVSISATNAGGTATLNATIVIAAAANGSATAVPALSAWGIILLALALAGAGALANGRGRMRDHS